MNALTLDAIDAGFAQAGSVDHEVGALEDLAPYVAKWDQASDLSQKALDMGNLVGGKTYLLPYGFYLRALFYNKKLFQQAGIANPPATLDDFLEDSKKISAIPGKAQGHTIPGGVMSLSITISHKA